MLTVLIPKPDTPLRRLAAGEDPGRRSRSIAGSYISDLAATRKMILLCPFCVHKFNPRRVQYEPWRYEQYVIAKCDDCRQMSRHIRAFIHSSTHDVVGDPEWRQRRRAKFLLPWSGR